MANMFSFIAQSPGAIFRVGNHCQRIGFIVLTTLEDYNFMPF